jgi:hypothetical protein
LGTLFVVILISSPDGDGPWHGEIKQDLVSLDNDGDAILEIDDPDSPTTIQFLISTRILSVASPIFASMFGPHFVEGQRLRVEKFIRIKLEDDNSHAMKTILEAFHHYHNTDLKPLNAKELACLAIHCDKYDCRAVLRPWTYYWFHNLEPVPQSRTATCDRPPQLSSRPLDRPHFSPTLGSIDT